MSPILYDIQVEINRSKFHVCTPSSFQEVKRHTHRQTERIALYCTDLETATCSSKCFL